MSPLFKSADIPHTAKFLLLRGSSSGNRFSDELAARADALALSTWPLHCNRRHLSEIAAFRFAVAAGFFSGVLVPMRPRIWLELARLGSTRQSLPLRCCVVVGPTDTAKIPWQASHADGQAAQPFGQHTGTESLVSILGKPYQVRPRSCARRFLETGAWRTVATVQSADMSAHSKEDVARLARPFLVCLLLHVVDGQQTSRVLGIAALAGQALERPGKSRCFWS